MAFFGTDELHPAFPPCPWAMLLLNWHLPWGKACATALGRGNLLR